jgi:hypothetical protein
MKKLVILLSLMLVACSSDDDNVVAEGNNVPQEDTLIGTWKLFEEQIFSSNSGNMVWIPVSEPFNHTYTFRTDNSVTRSNLDCDGTYENNPADYLEVTFDCPEYLFVKEHYISFDNHNLILTPPGSCDEAGVCAYKYEKIITD